MIVMAGAKNRRNKRARPPYKTLEDGRAQRRPFPPYKILIVSRGSQLKKIGAQALMDFINPFVEERAYLAIQKKVTLKEERKFVDDGARALDSGCEVRIFLFVDDKVVGNCSVRQATLQSDNGNVSFGIAVSKEFRGFGFGELLLRKGLEVAKKKFKPHKMWIDHVGGNNVAARLYRKVGFVKVARLKEYHLHHGEWHDKVMMEHRE